MAKRDLPTQEYLQARLSYEPETGQFHWLHNQGGRDAWNTRFEGKRAGGLTCGGRYWEIHIDDVGYYAHRVAYVWMQGPIPQGIEVDHWDLDGTNNRWSNIRAATRGQNLANTRGSSALGNPKGTYQHRSGKFVARLSTVGYKSYIGIYPTREEAAAAYLAEAQRRYGEFARGD